MSFSLESDPNNIPDLRAVSPFLLQRPKLPNENNLKEHIPNEKKSHFFASQNSGTMQTSRSINFPKHPTFDDDTEEETEIALKRRNQSLRDELKALSVELSSLLAKQRISKPEVPPKLSTSMTSHGVNSEEIRLHLELETAQKQLLAYRKEHNQLRNKNDEFLDPMKRIEQTEKVFELESKIEKETAANRTLNKLIREKGKEIEHLQKEASVGQKEANISDMLIAMNNKYRTIVNNENKLVEQRYNKESYIEKLEDQLEKLKENYNHAAERTGYIKTAQKEKDRAKTKSVSRFKKIALESAATQMTPRNASAAWKNNDEDQEEMNFTAENFSKLHSKLKIIKKSDTVKQRAWRREMHDLHGQTVAHEKERQEAKTLLSEVEREVDILNSVFKELNSICLRHNVQLPSQERKQIKKLDNLDAGLLSARVKEKIQLPQISTRSHKSEAKHKMTEKVIREQNDDSEFNDRDLIKNQSVQIVGMKVWYDGKRLNGVQALYKTYTGKKFEGKKHGLNLYKYRVAKFEMEGDDYLKDLTGYLSPDGTAVICLVFKFSSGENRKVGQPQEKSRQFKFDIGPYEFPAIIYGSIIEEKNESILGSLGVLIGSEDDFPAENEMENPGDLFEQNISSITAKTSLYPEEKSFKK